jgi:hypothetical protein
MLGKEHMDLNSFVRHVFSIEKLNVFKTSATAGHIAFGIAITKNGCCSFTRLKNVLQDVVNQTFHGCQFIFPGVICRDRNWHLLHH